MKIAIVVLVHIYTEGIISHTTAGITPRLLLLCMFIAAVKSFSRPDIEDAH